jgi:uncharacterized RDD family membrane protein YckC
MKTRPSKALVIAIPEGAELAFPLAGGVSRFLAWFIDLLILAMLSVMAPKVLGVAAILGASWQQAMTLLAYFLLSTGYAILCEWRWRGQTVGKRLFRLRVMDAGGLYLTFAQVVIRNLVRLLDILPLAYLVGGVVAVSNQYSQRLGDLAAGTVVVREPVLAKWRMPDLDTRFNSLAAYPRLVARVRHSASRELIQIAMAAVLRREQLSADARVILFDELRRQFLALVSFPETALEYLSSEQYVRNLLAAISSGR